MDEPTTQGKGDGVPVVLGSESDRLSPIMVGAYVAGMTEDERLPSPEGWGAVEMDERCPDGAFTADQPEPGPNKTLPVLR